MGDAEKAPLLLQIIPRVRLEYHGAAITCGAGLLPIRELDHVLSLTLIASGYFQESRAGPKRGTGYHVELPETVTPEQMDEVPREARPEMSVGRIFRQVIGEIYQHQGHIAYLKGLARA